MKKLAALFASAALLAGCGGSFFADIERECAKDDGLFLPQNNLERNTAPVPSSETRPVRAIVCSALAPQRD